MSQVSFAADIKPLFRAIDISHMKQGGVELDNYTYMSNPDNANRVLATLLPHDGKVQRCPLADPIGVRLSWRYSRNGRRTDISRKLFCSAGTFHDSVQPSGLTIIWSCAAEPRRPRILR